jgi:hypothetical protein
MTRGKQKICHADFPGLLTPPQIGTLVTLTCRYTLGKTTIWLQRWVGGRCKVILSSVCNCLHHNDKWSGYSIISPTLPTVFTVPSAVSEIMWSWWNLQLLLIVCSQNSGVSRGGLQVQTPPKFQSFHKAKLNSLFCGKYIHNLTRIWVSLICKLSWIPD